MTAPLEVLQHFELEIDESEVLRLQGYRRGAPASPPVLALVHEAVATAHHLARPRAVYAVFDVTAADGITLSGGRRLMFAGLPREWLGLERLALALCTIGADVEATVARLFEEGDLALASMLDSAGSVAVENLADQVNHTICQQARTWQLVAGPRISPGYGRWALEEQRTVFDVLPAASIGVELTEGLMMRPLKSISFGVGLGRELAAGNTDVCRRCGMVRCQVRRTGGVHG